jgi:tetratricopeptide (TPR) repeat protein
MPDAVDTNTRQSSAGEGSLVVGKIRQPTGLWPAVEGITQTDPIRNGVLIIFANDVRGRVGIFCNRYISGAINDTTGSTGVQAAKELLAASAGMFGFRPCMGNEPVELAQDIALDLDELLLLRDEKNDIVDALMLVAAPGKGERIRDTKTMEPLTTKSSSGTFRAYQAAPVIEKSSQNDQFSYMDWFADEQATQSDNLPKFRQILMGALPAGADAKAKTAGPSAQDDLALYGRLLESEKAKVVRDIELSMQRARKDGGTDTAENDEAISELKMMSDFIQSEQARAQKWSGLDQIPTPRAGLGKANPGNIPRETAPEYGDKTDLLSVSRHHITLPKDFIRRVAIEEPPPREFFNLDWLRRPWVVATASLSILAVVVAGISTMQSRSEFEDCLAQAKGALKLRHPDDAVYVLNKAIEKDGSNHRAFFYRGLAYSAMGEYDKAAKDFETSMNLGGPRTRTKIARASAACQAGNFEDAVTDCTDVLKENENNVEALMIRATSYERLKDYSKVIRDTTHALSNAKDPDNRAHLLLQRGVAYTKEGKPNDAERDFGDAIHLKPDAPTYMQRGDAYRSLRAYGQAAADYSKVISFDPRNYEAYVARGIAYGAIHKDREALKDFARALSINKTGVEAMIQRGSLLLSNAHYRLAANDFEDAMALCPHDVETQQKLAMAYTHLHKTFPKAWLHNTEVVAATERPGSRISSTGAAGEAPATMDGGFKMPTDTKQLLSVGYQYLTNGQVSYATQMFSEAVRKEPNNADARRYLAHALLSSGSTAAAVSQFDALVDLDALTPRDASAYVKALTASGDTNRAADVLAQCVESRPRDLALRAELMRLYNSMGLTAKSQACYQQGLRYARSATQRAELDAALRSRTSTPGSTPSQSGDGSQLGG